MDYFSFWISFCAQVNNFNWIVMICCVIFILWVFVMVSGVPTNLLMNKILVTLIKLKFRSGVVKIKALQNPILRYAKFNRMNWSKMNVFAKEPILFELKHEETSLPDHAKFWLQVDENFPFYRFQAAVSAFDSDAECLQASEDAAITIERHVHDLGGNMVSNRVKYMLFFCWVEHFQQ